MHARCGGSVLCHVMRHMCKRRIATCTGPLSLILEIGKPLFSTILHSTNTAQRSVTQSKFNCCKAQTCDGAELGKRCRAHSRKRVLLGWQGEAQGSLAARAAAHHLIIRARKQATATPKPTLPMAAARSASFSCRGVSSSPAPPTSAMVRPHSLDVPVATTSSRPLPSLTWHTRRTEVAAVGV